MLVELLRLSGGQGAELARRWLAALMLAPATEREAIVQAVEARMTELYDAAQPAVDDGATGDAPGEDEGPLLHISTEPVQRPGYIERMVRSYEAAPKRGASAKSTKSKRRSG